MGLLIDLFAISARTLVKQGRKVGDEFNLSTKKKQLNFRMQEIVLNWKQLHFY
ncbi:hypothetical protein [Methyloversatilis sp. XJ19-13]|uniref:hypothetical protein n=1 Tax=Methyloversatilis sp. XJ19-13 TaxID=2963430 RepID=UPI00211CBE90|nr:hypothetical protein [Methyloversatilis sp. XJ19-13]